jgi:hypothetical protein
MQKNTSWPKENEGPVNRGDHHRQLRTNGKYQHLWDKAEETHRQGHYQQGSLCSLENYDRQLVELRSALETEAPATEGSKSTTRLAIIVIHASPSLWTFKFSISFKTETDLGGPLDCQELGTASALIAEPCIGRKSI